MNVSATLKRNPSPTKKKMMLTGNQI